MLDSGGFALGRRTAVGVLACALLLAGCAEKHEASTTLPSASGNASASASEGITAKVLPPVGPADFPVPIEARERTPAGAVAFTRYYVDLMNRQAETLDAQPLRDLSQKCETCSQLADNYDQMKAAGYRYQGGHMTVLDVEPGPIKGTEAQTAFLLEQAPISVRKPSGAEVSGRSFPLTKYTGGSILQWDDQSSTWLMAQFDAERA